jgi:hypothetical protein
LFKSFRIKEPPVLGLLGAKTIKEPHSSWKIWQKTNNFMGSYLMSSSVLRTVVIYEIGYLIFGVIVNLIPNRGFVAISITRPTLLWTTCFVC